MRRAFIRNQYGDNICELEHNGYGWVIPNGEDPFPCHFEDGDTYTIIEEEE